jgi:quinol monooxygenase YgiN
VRRLWDYLDGRLPPTGHDEVEAHLAACALCPPHFAFAGTMQGALAASTPPMEDAAEERLRERVRAALGRLAASDVSRPLPGEDMHRLALLALLEARPGKEEEAEAFLKAALPMARAEPGTLSWYALKLGPSRFGIFDTFADQEGRDAHLSGEIARALFARAEELFAQPPVVEQIEILAAKASGA